MRILPIVLFMEILTVLVSGTKLSWGYLFNVFIFPTEFWFTGAIILFYPLLFIIEKIDKKALKIIVVAILLVLHLIRDDIFAERYFIGFIAMIIGTEVRKYVDRRSCDHPVKIVIGTGVSAFLVVFLKLARSRGYEWYGLIHLLTEITVVFFAVFLFMLLYKNEKKIEKLCLKLSFLGKTVSFLGGITLATYMIQLFDDAVIIRYMGNFRFPVSVLSCTAVICALAWILTGVDKRMRKIFVEKMI